MGSNPTPGRVQFIPFCQVNSRFEILISRTGILYFKTEWWLSFIAYIMCETQAIYFILIDGRSAGKILLILFDLENSLQFYQYM